MSTTLLEISSKLDLPLDRANQSIAATNDIEAIKIWLYEYIESSNTFISYKQCAERFYMWLSLNNISLAQVSREDIARYQEFLKYPTPQETWCGVAKPRQHPEWKPFVKGLGSSSIRLNIQILSSLYQYLVESGYLNKNPFRLIRRKNANIVKNQAIDRYLTNKEWQYVVDYIESMPRSTPKELSVYHRTRWVFNLLYQTAARRSEIANGHMADFKNIHGNWWLSVIGKGNKHGEIPITNNLLAELITYRTHLKLAVFPSSTETDIPLVASISGNNKQISDSMLYKMIKNTVQDISNKLLDKDPAAAYVIAQVSTHWLRHTSATHQVDAGIDIRVVKENLRHSMIETTMRYQHTEQDARHAETNTKFGGK